MKNYFFSTTLFFFCTILSTALFAQKPTVPESEFTGTILLVNPDNTTAQKLEKQTASAASKADIGAALVGVSKGSSTNKVNGASSPVRLKGGKTVRLIVRVKDNSRDPVEVINVFKLDSNKDKNNRILVVSKHVLNKSSALDIKFLPLEGEKYGTSSYLITLNNLEPGEYAATLDGTRMVFNLFGIDTE